jgi:hypothetical protein
MALFRGGDEDDAYVGAILIAEFLRTARDYDRRDFKRSW